MSPINGIQEVGGSIPPGSTTSFFFDERSEVGKA
jgi:hypothetical protein